MGGTTLLVFDLQQQTFVAISIMSVLDLITGVNLCRSEAPYVGYRGVAILLNSTNQKYIVVNFGIASKMQLYDPHAFGLEGGCILLWYIACQAINLIILRSLENVL